MRYNFLHLAAAGMIILAIGLLALGMVRGEVAIYLFIIFPVIVSTGILGLAATLLFFFGFVLLFFASAASMIYPSEFYDTAVEPPVMEDFRAVEPERVDSHTSYGGVVFIGPIPIIFGSDEKMARGMMYIGLIIAIILLIAFLL